MKTTKRSLLACGLALLLCLTMLAGTTFAWFTDSVTSANNKIQSGTLKIDLLVKGANGYESVKESHEALFDYDKWEPGFTVAKNLKVMNLGNLALKYTLKFVSAGDIAGAKLAEAIEVYYAPTEKTVTRANYASELNYLGTLKDVFSYDDATVLNGVMIPGQSDEAFATLVLHMKEDAGNDYQNQTIPAFDIRLEATQYTYEADSFDDQYDALANGNPDHPEFDQVTASAGTVAGTATVLRAPGVTATISADAVDTEDVTSLTLVVSDSEDSDSVITVSTGSDSKYIDISLYDQDDQVVESFENNGYADVAIEIGTDLIITEVNHKQAVLTTDTTQAEYYSYNAATGILTLHVTSFSPFSIGYNEAVAKVGATLYSSLSGAVSAWQNTDSATLTLLKDGTLNALQVIKTLTLDLNGKTLTLKGHASAGTTGGAIYIDGGANWDHGNLTIENGTLNMPGTNFSTYGIYNYGTLTCQDVTINSECTTAVYVNGQQWGTVGTTTLTNTTVTATKDAFAAYAYKGPWASAIPTVSISDSTIQGKNAVSLYAVQATVDNSTFTATSDRALFVANAAMASGVTGDVTLSGDVTLNASSAYYQLSKSGSHTISVEAGTYNFDPTAYVASGCTATDNGDGTWTVA